VGGRLRLVSRLLPSGNQRAITVLVIGLIVFFSLTTPVTFVSTANAANLLRQMSFNAVIALGVVVVMAGGGLDISVGAVMSMSAAVVMGFQPHGVPVAVVMALAFGVAVGAINGVMVAWFDIVPFVATLGTMTIASGLVHEYSHDMPIPGANVAFTVLGGGNLGPIPVPVLFMIGLAIVIHVTMTHTPFGRAVYAVGGDFEAARLAGINVALTRFSTYVISGFCSSLAGILLASELNTSSTQLGIDTPLLILAAVIMGGASLLGGRGTAVGALLGVLALGLLATGLDGLGVQTAQQTIIRAVIFVAIVVLDVVSVGRLWARLRLRTGLSRGREATPM